MKQNVYQNAFTHGTDYGLEEAAEVTKLIQQGAPTNARYVKRFEKEFANYVGAQYGVATNSWVGAAQLLTILLEIKDGDEIIVPAFTFQASANIFYKAGAKIVFADCDSNTFNIDPQKVEEKINSNTRAIVAVHMCGQPCDMNELISIAKKYNILIIQDVAHAPGATYQGRKLGELSDFAIYSFHQTKNMSTLGEGGMIVTNNIEYAEKMRRLREHGAGIYIGISSRMTEIQAAVGLIQLQKLYTHNMGRRKSAYYLNEYLKDIPGIKVPVEIKNVFHTYHLYNIIIEEEMIKMSRDEFIAKLWTKKKIMATTQYHPTVNCLPAYKKVGHGKGECPIAEELSKKVVTLPITYRYMNEEIAYLATSIKELVYNEERLT